MKRTILAPAVIPTRSSSARRSFMARLMAVLLALALLTVPASAAVQAGKWKGTSEQKLKVFFTVKGNKVTEFTAAIRMTCTLGGGIYIDAINHEKAIPIKNGRFSFKGKEPTGAPYEFKGRISKGSAKGTMNLFRGRYTPQGAQSCSAFKPSWKATPARG